MIDWTRGGWTGSLNSWVRLEVREQLRDNTAARNARHPPVLRVLRCIFAGRTFGQFIGFYLALNLLVVAGELIAARSIPDLLPLWTLSSAPGGPGISAGPDIKTLLTSVAGYLIGAQVGVLGVISIALALVTLIAQREGSGTDVQVYYHEALAFEMVASSIALLAVLCVQLIWPLQFLLHRFGEGTSLQFFKLLLLSVHMAWLLLNLTVLTHFVTTTFDFVQQSAREKLRERYTANAVVPVEMTNRLREQLYLGAGQEFKGDDADGPSVFFGFEFDPLDIVEVEGKFARPTLLHDIRMTWVSWVVRRWITRCQAARLAHSVRRVAGLPESRPRLAFTPQLSRPLRGTVGWCCRHGGVPLTSIERFILKSAFQFRRAPHDA